MIKTTSERIPQLSKYVRYMYNLFTFYLHVGVTVYTFSYNYLFLIIEKMYKYTLLNEKLS